MCDRTSSVGRGLHCYTGGRRFSPCGQTNIQGLKGTAFALQMDRPWRGLDDHIKKMAVLSLELEIK